MLDIVIISLAVLASVLYLARCLWRWWKRQRGGTCSGCDHCGS